MNFIKRFHEMYSINEKINFREIFKLAKEYDYDTFLNKTDSITNIYNILYRGYLDNGLDDNIFMTDYIGHAREYGDNIDGIVYDNHTDVLYFDDDTFDDLRTEFSKLSMEDIGKIYSYSFENDKLFNAMDGKYHTEKLVVKFVHNFINSKKPYSTIQQLKINDLIIPIMVYYAEIHGKNIISFIGGDYAEYGGSNEFVVNDISKYKTLKQIWDNSNK